MLLSEELYKIACTVNRKSNRSIAETTVKMIRTLMEHKQAYGGQWKHYRLIWTDVEKRLEKEGNLFFAKGEFERTLFDYHQEKEIYGN